jgi:hypothetical protein
MLIQQEEIGSYETKVNTITVITIIILISVYIWWDELIELLWLTLSYVIFPAIGIYLIKGFSDYRKKVTEQNEVELKRALDEENKHEELERKFNKKKYE